VQSFDAALSELSHSLLDKDVAALSREEHKVLARIAKRAPISQDIARTISEQATWWERLSDRVAKIGGSWTFIFAFSATLLGWIALNSTVLKSAGLAFDVYPFIFLNLLLSTVAALQAPVIMMSQNRQSDKDRVAAAHDYEVNLRAELEIMRLHDKLDALRTEQTRALIQQQTETLAMLREELEKSKR
jgi:uncharacterized membrane protein